MPAAMGLQGPEHPGSWQHSTKWQANTRSSLLTPAVLAATTAHVGNLKQWSRTLSPTSQVGPGAGLGKSMARGQHLAMGTICWSVSRTSWAYVVACAWPDQYQGCRSICWLQWVISSRGWCLECTLEMTFTARTRSDCRSCGGCVCVWVSLANPHSCHLTRTWPVCLGKGVQLLSGAHDPKIYISRIPPRTPPDTGASPCLTVEPLPV